MNIKEKLRSAPPFTSLCFLTPDAVWPATSRSRHGGFRPVPSNWEPKINPSLFKSSAFSDWTAHPWSTHFRGSVLRVNINDLSFHLFPLSLSVTWAVGRIGFNSPHEAFARNLGDGGGWAHEDGGEAFKGTRLFSLFPGLADSSEGTDLRFRIEKQYSLKLGHVGKGKLGKKMDIS